MCEPPYWDSVKQTRLSNTMPGTSWRFGGQVAGCDPPCLPAVVRSTKEGQVASARDERTLALRLSVLYKSTCCQLACSCLRCMSRGSTTSTSILFQDGIFFATQGCQLLPEGAERQGRERIRGGHNRQIDIRARRAETEIAFSCRVLDDLGGEGMLAMKMKME